MFIKSDIRRVTLALEKAHGREVYARLGRAGILHLARLQAEGLFTEAGMEALEAKTRDALMAGNYVLNTLGLASGQEGGPQKQFDKDRDFTVIFHAKKVVDRLHRLREKLREKAALIGEEISDAEVLARMGIDPGVLKKAQLARMVFGRVSEPLLDLPANESFVLASEERYVFGVSLPHALPRMTEFLKEKGFADKTGKISGASPDSLKRRDADLKQRLKALDAYADAFRKEKGPDLVSLCHSLEGYEEVQRAMRQSAFSEKAIFITGWLDVKDRARLLALLQEFCGECYLLAEERDPDAPVRLINSRLFKPFELIVTTMGMPANSEIDPTPFAGILFVLIFGLMFGDLGQGLVLAALGLILKSYAKKSAQEELYQAGGILTACGFCAAFCGVLYGSLFSSEQLIPALWIHPVENIMTLFSFTLLLGAFIIVLGLCVNIFNAFKNKNYPEAFLEKKGLAILILYCAMIGMAVRYAGFGLGPAFWEIGLFIILPLLVFSLRGFLGPLLFRTKPPHDFVEYLTETLMEILEIAISLFANTVSFIRVGAFALSHAGLSIVTYALAGMADPSLMTPGALFIIVLGNIFIIGFEGLICGIQSMRLEFYEFFSKFFKGDGVAFSPFILKTKIQEV